MAKPPDVAFGCDRAPLHLVVLGLTSAPPRRIVHGSPDRNRDAHHVHHRPHSPVHARPPGSLGTTDDASDAQLPLSHRQRDEEERQMARGNGTTVASHERTAKTKTTGRTTASTPHLAGPYGASFTGEGTRGLTFERRWTTPGDPPLRRDHLGVPDRRHRQRIGQVGLRAEGRRGPRLLVAARHQRRGQQVLPRPPRHPGARDQRQASSSTGSSTRSRPGRRPSTTSRPTRTSPPSRRS